MICSFNLLEMITQDVSLKMEMMVRQILIFHTL